MNAGAVTSDLARHAGDKVSRALDDVLQLASEPGEIASISIMAAGVCIGKAAGAWAAQSGRSIDECVFEIIDLMRDNAKERRR